MVMIALFLISQAPAWLLGSALQKFVPNIVTLQQTHGSVWNGRGRAQARLPHGAALDLGVVRWRLQPLALVTGKLAAELEALDVPQGGRVQVSVAIGVDRSARLTGLRAQMPAALLAQLVPQLGLLQPDGRVEIFSDALTLADSGAEGKLTATWRRFATKMSKVNPLGDYKLDTELGKGPISFRLSSPAGPLLIEGSGNWSTATRLNFDGSARLGPGAPGELANLVRLFGRDQGGGSYAIKLQNF